jgi:hypothetical protein
MLRPFGAPIDLNGSNGFVEAWTSPAYSAFLIRRRAISHILMMLSLIRIFCLAAIPLSVGLMFLTYARGIGSGQELVIGIMADLAVMFVGVASSIAYFTWILARILQAMIESHEVVTDAGTRERLLDNMRR